MSVNPVLLGRGADLDRIREAILRDVAGSVLILGSAGQGKSALARAAMEDDAVVQRFGARRYWADVTGARTETDLVTIVARALGVSDGSSLRGRVLEQLAEAPALLVLKGAEVTAGSGALGMDEFAFALHRIPTLAWVATTRGLREALSVRWSEVIRLEPLTVEQATRAFIETAGAAAADDPMLPTLIDASRLLPGALELLARQARLPGGAARVWEQWQATGFIEESDLQPPEERAIAHALAAAVHALQVPGAVRLMSAVATVPDGLATDDLDALEDIPTGTAVDELSSAGILARETGRCRVVALLVPHVLRFYPAEARDREAVDDLYLRLTEACGPRAGGDGGQAAMHRLSIELRNVETTLARGLQAESPRACRATYQYANYQRHSGLGDPSLIERARALAGALGDAPLAADCTARAGDLAINRFDHPTASERYDEARLAYRALNDARGEAHCMRNLGVIAMRTQRWAAARALLEQAATLAHSVEDEAGEVSSLERLGDVAEALGERDTARRYFEEAQRRYQAIGDPREANCWMSLGTLALEDKDEKVARDLLEKALALHTKAGHQLGIANSLMYLGTLDASAAPALATKRYDMALPLYRRIGNVWGEGNVRILLADLALAANDIAKAGRLYREAFNLHRAADNRTGAAEAISGLAKVADAEGRPEAARAFRQEAATLDAANERHPSAS